jgi:hypothetical protein
MLREWIRGISYKYPTAAKAAVGAPEKPFHSPGLGTPCCETKVRALNAIPMLAWASTGAPAKGAWGAYQGWWAEGNGKPEKPSGPLAARAPEP